MQKEFSSQEIHFGLSLAQEVFSGAVFGETLDIRSISESRIKKLIAEVYCYASTALAPLAAFQPQLVAHILDKTILKSVAFVSAVAYELLKHGDNLVPLAKAGAAMALVQIADHLMDRGDAKMVTAISNYFENLSSNDAEIQARADILEAIADLSADCSPDEGDIIADAMLAILRDELAVFQLSKRYANLTNTAAKEAFMDEYACHIANLSICNVGLRPGTYMVYSCYRLAFPELPPLQDFIFDIALDEFSYFGEWAIRLWDDFGDQEIDAGQGIYTNSYIINPFVEQNELLTETYFTAIADKGAAFNMINALSRGKYDNLNKLIILYLRSLNEKLPAELEGENGLYLGIMRRIIEGGFVNTLGDEGISYTADIIADYA